MKKVLFLLLLCSGLMWPGPTSYAQDATRPETQAETPDQFKALELSLKELLKERRVAGLSATLVRDGKISWSGAYGWADVAQKKPITPDTLFQLASVSKTVTVCAILQQVEQGLLDLDADINDVLPFKVRHPGHPEVPITLRALLTHTAAIGDNWTILEDTWVKDADFPMPLGASLKQYLVAGEKWYKPRKNYQRWAPGKRNEYSNIGIALAAYVAEVAAKQPFEQLCEKGIFAPLKMTRSSYRLKSLNKSEIAIPHEWKDGKQVPLGHHGYLDYPSGTLRTSAPQLARFLLCIMNEGKLAGNRILSQKMVREMLRVQDSDIEDTQALVWFRESEEGATLIGHDGSDPGVLTMMFFDLEKKTGFILLMNGEPKGRDIDDEILEMLIPLLSK